MKMMESAQADDIDWPTLGGTSTEPKIIENMPQAPGKPASTADGDDWELLSDASESARQVTDKRVADSSSIEDESIISFEKELIESATEQKESLQPKLTENANPKSLRHCSSSPNLSNPNELGSDCQSATDNSYAIVSGPASVVSWATSASGLSFKDAILANMKNEPSEKSESQSLSSTQKTTRPFKPRFVVVKPPNVKRCAKGSGDVKSLSPLVEDEFDYGAGGGCSDEILGAADAMEFYNQKAMGASGRTNGLKIRPDEAKRREMIINKKNMQRRVNEARNGGGKKKKEKGKK